MQRQVTFSCDDGFPMPGRLTTPDGQMQQPGRGCCLFARGGKPLCVARCIRTIATGRGEPLHDLDAARRYLVDLPEVDSERILKSSPARPERNLTQLGIPHDVKVYPQAGHSFYTPAPNRAAQLIGPFTPLRAQYHEPSARDARKRVVAFFRERL